ncbi:MAG: alpha/beta hydrolase [Burkholderiaceae bacterium]
MTRLRRLVTIGLLPLAALALLAACAPVATLNALVPRGSHELQPNVAYGDNPRQRLDIYRPIGAAPPAGWPMAVFFYGGSWNEGKRADYEFVAEALAARGVLTLVADYRLYPEVRYPDFLYDSAHALAYGIEHAGALHADPKRIFVMGHSAGAYNAAMLAFDPRWLAATQHRPSELAGFIGLAGPYDFLPMTNPDAQPVFFHPNYPPGTQPLGHASSQAPRTFLGAPQNDRLVDPQRNTIGLANKLQSLGVPVTVRLYPRTSHVTLAGSFAAPLRFLSPVLEDVLAFIEQTPPRP